MNYKQHGKKSNVIVLHGGPGAVGSAAGLCKTIENCYELYNYKQSIEGHISEIQDLIRQENLSEIILVGYSYGAWLAYLYASRYPVAKIILIGSGAFDRKYLASMNQKRHNKLSQEEQDIIDTFLSRISQGQSTDDLPDCGHLLSKMDAYEMDYDEKELISFDLKGHEALMAEINDLRSSKALLDAGTTIRCPIQVIHGDYDPHPLEGVIEPFDTIGLKYQLRVLNKCGHTPWHEKYAKDSFKKLIQRSCAYIIETDRLGLRHFNPGDSEWFHKMNSDDEVMTYFPNKLDQATSDAFLNRIIQGYQDNGFGLYAVELKECQTPIGFIGLSKPSFEMDFTPCVEIGWRLHKNFWHKGYATEGALELLKYAFEQIGLDRVYSFTALINKPSIQVMERIGMTYVKSFNHPKVKNSPLEEHVLYVKHGKNGQEK